MSVTLIKSSKGQEQHYSYVDDNASGVVAEILDFDVTGQIVDTIAPSENVTADAEGWNNFKNATVYGDDSTLIALEPFLTSPQLNTVLNFLGSEVVTLEDFVHVDADFSGYIRSVELTH